MAQQQKLKLTLSLSALEDLGINLYSNTAAVMAELVANAWDADAKNVWISVAKDGGERSITITDDGIGMSERDINEKYLTVGYKRREVGHGETPSGRLVMGRKGIGKLSVFSIANRVVIHTLRGAAKTAFALSVDEIRRQIKKKLDYFPGRVPFDSSISKGTTLILSELRPNIRASDAYLRRRLARRFGILDGAHDFSLFVNGTQVTLADREYYDKFQYLWRYDDDAVKNLASSTLAYDEPRRSLVSSELEDARVHGWIASVKKREQMHSTDEDNLNRVSLFFRNKMAHEDILEEFTEAGVYSKYLIGEIHADFLDLDDQRDISTSSRQRVIEDDPRYQALKKFLREELKHIETQWSELRNAEGRELALEIPAVNKWFNQLTRNEQRRATAVLGKVNQLPLDDDEEKRTYFKQMILAFEIYRVKHNLDAIQNLRPDELTALAAIFDGIDQIEATLYYQIVEQRVGKISILEQLTDDDAKERFLQDHIYNDLWLIDPSWERAAEDPVMERPINKLLKDVDTRLPIEYKTG